MPTGINNKKIGTPFGNEEKVIKVVYDFAKDGGAIGTFDLFTASQACIITGFHMVVQTACTSGGAATVSAGYTGAVAGLLTATAVASLTANAVFGENGAFDQVKRLASGETAGISIATAALTAGKIEMTLKIQKA